MRGKHHHRSGCTSSQRNIPAHAGKTRQSGLDFIVGEEHPRACGENIDPAIRRRHGGGTSPRMRGKPGSLLAPARRVVEHPRACGENLNPVGFSLSQRGTSPRMRGKLIEQRNRFAHERNIPAHAGKTLSGLWRRPLTQEHPRACGENIGIFVTYKHSLGTSPRMRGKPDAGNNDEGLRWNIPAHAGKTI